MNLIKNLKSLQNEIHISIDQKRKVEDFIMAKIAKDFDYNYKQNKVSIWLRLADILVPQNLALQPVAIFSLILGLFLITSFASINASKNSLPGDTLYPVKITAENVRYNLTFSDQEKAKVAMSLVENRVNEFKSIVGQEDDSQKQEKIVQATEKIKNSLDKVKDKVQQIDQKSKDEGVVETVKEIDHKLALVKDEIGSLKNEGNEVKEIINQVEETSVVVLALLDKKTETPEYNANEVVANTEDVANKLFATSTSSSTSQEMVEINQLSSSEILNTSSDIVVPGFELVIEEVKEKSSEEFKVRIDE